MTARCPKCVATARHAKYASSTREAGFTLLEILVALTVFGFLMIGLGQGVDFGFRLWNNQSDAIAQRGNLTAVDSALRAMISAMDPGFSIDPPNIVGLPEAFAFTTELPAGAASDDARHADVSLSVDARHQFVLHWTAHLHADRLGGGAVIQTAVLLNGVADVRFRYLDQSAGYNQWVTHWNARTPPALVAMTITFLEAAGNAAPEWPAIVVAPMRQRSD